MHITPSPLPSPLKGESRKLSFRGGDKGEGVRIYILILSN